METTTITAIKTLRSNILASREAVASIEAQGLPAADRSRAITKAGPSGYQAVISAIEADPSGEGLSEDILDAAWEAAEACQGFGWRSSAAVDRFVALTEAL
jgi:phage tail sheath gpL-like